MTPNGPSFHRMTPALRSLSPVRIGAGCIAIGRRSRHLLARQLPPHFAGTPSRQT